MSAEEIAEEFFKDARFETMPQPSIKALRLVLVSAVTRSVEEAKEQVLNQSFPLSLLDLKNFYKRDLEKITRECAAQERERCAKIVEEFRSDDIDYGHREQAIAKAIREVKI